MTGPDDAFVHDGPGRRVRSRRAGTPLLTASRTVRRLKTTRRRLRQSPFPPRQTPQGPPGASRSAGRRVR
ncbi:uncharacterized protein SCHCODRAFT_02105363 [Schizophyllum commune H4-8]|uniref:uncharacterized protein n=1 Tax=Schizophyllum commune (strain H4-8 / FGSC 9210) TaxID=578458 RepID=UPI00215F5889|nr:uncharacterized protein SCHCODRAFT_02105363 [Schizophyllum commune H4-8]KAI5885777.1 hypothetical protein SCHCODRAFT_02105363 [Schizophyllum commune H4-8]